MLKNSAPTSLSFKFNDAMFLMTEDNFSIPYWVIQLPARFSIDIKDSKWEVLIASTIESKPVF
jgi:hypothetical protein